MMILMNMTKTIQLKQELLPHIWKVKSCKNRKDFLEVIGKQTITYNVLASSGATNPMWLRHPALTGPSH